MRNPRTSCNRCQAWWLFGWLQLALTLSLYVQPAASQSALPLGDQVQVNVYTTNRQTRPAVGMDGEGNFVVVWESYDLTSTEADIKGRIYSSGLPAGPEAQVNTYATGLQRRPAVGVATEGDFVVVWQSYGSAGNDSDRSSVQGQRYGSNGLPVGTEFQINSYTTSEQRRPDVGVQQSGGFVAVWMSTGSFGNDDSNSSIQGRLYASNGLPLGLQGQINSFVAGDQGNPTLAAANGVFVVAWSSQGSSDTDTSDYSIQSQRFAISLFVDGFEPGNAWRWSSTTP